MLRSPSWLIIDYFSLGFSFDCEFEVFFNNATFQMIVLIKQYEIRFKQRFLKPEPTKANRFFIVQYISVDSELIISDGSFVQIETTQRNYLTHTHTYTYTQKRKEYYSDIDRNKKKRKWKLLQLKE